MFLWGIPQTPPSSLRFNVLECLHILIELGSAVTYEGFFYSEAFEEGEASETRKIDGTALLA